jgi:hypothetical protein
VRSTRLACVAVIAAALTATILGAAHAWEPEETISLLVGFSPGGLSGTTILSTGGAQIWAAWAFVMGGPDLRRRRNERWRRSLRTFCLRT